MGKPESIAAAAVMEGGETFSLPPPARHHTVLRHIDEVWPLTKPRSTKVRQGFITSRGRFVERAEAYRIAKAAGQITHRREGPQYYQGEELFSEDMW